MMGVMTLALSVFSIVPMALSLNNRLYLSRVVVHMLNRYARPTEEVKIEEQQSPFEPMEFWGTVSEMFKKDGPDQLPAEDDTKVTRLAAAMLIFFIVCIILLVVYLVCSVMLMYGSVRGSRWLILPWLVATFLFILAYIAGMCLSTVLFGITLLSLAFLTIAIIESCIALYLWLCVISLFQLLADRHGNQVTIVQGVSEQNMILIFSYLSMIPSCALGGNVGIESSSAYFSIPLAPLIPKI